MQVLLWRVCSQMTAPPQTLQLLLMRLCSQMLALPLLHRIVGVLPRRVDVSPLLAAIASLAPLLPVPHLPSHQTPPRLRHWGPAPASSPGPFSTAPRPCAPARSSISLVRASCDRRPVRARVLPRVGRGRRCTGRSRGRACGRRPVTRRTRGRQGRGRAARRCRGLAPQTPA